MSEWRSEVRDELESAKARLAALGSEVKGEPTEDQLRSTWRAYLSIEKSIAFIRVELREENPGRFINTKPYVVPDERQALAFASRFLERGIEEFRLGDLMACLKALRESRNYLRMLLRRKTLQKRSRARQSRQST